MSPTHNLHAFKISTLMIIRRAARASVSEESTSPITKYFEEIDGTEAIQNTTSIYASAILAPRVESQASSRDVWNNFDLEIIFREEKEHTDASSSVALLSEHGIPAVTSWYTRRVFRSVHLCTSCGTL